MKFEHIMWSQDQFNIIKDGGYWGVPRSGLMFQKRGYNKLVLVETMPWDKTLPISARQLLHQQTDEYKNIKEHFSMAGIIVSSEVEDIR